MARPIGSNIRNNMIEIVSILKTVHGYELFNAYRTIFGPVAFKSIYYNLSKGVDTGEFEIESAKEEAGDFSWGSTAMKTYYKLGPTARPKKLSYVKKDLEKNGFLKGRK